MGETSMMNSAWLHAAGKEVAVSEGGTGEGLGDAVGLVSMAIAVLVPAAAVFWTTWCVDWALTVCTTAVSIKPVSGAGVRLSNPQVARTHINKPKMTAISRTRFIR
jgi:hypothetical protein